MALRRVVTQCGTRSPMTVNQMYNMSLSRRSNLRHQQKMLRGHPLRPLIESSMKKNELVEVAKPPAELSAIKSMMTPSRINEAARFLALSVPGILDMEQVGGIEVPWVWGFFSLAILGGVVAAGPFPVVQYENKVFANPMGGREQEGVGSTWPVTTAVLLPLFLGSMTDLAMGTWSYMFWLTALGFIGLWLTNPIGRYGFDHYWLDKVQTPVSNITRWLSGAAWVLRLPLRVGWGQFLIGFRLTVNVLRILNSFLLLSVGLETIITIMELVIFNVAMWSPVDYMFWYFMYLCVCYCKGLLLILHLRLMITLSCVWLHPARYMSSIKKITA